MLDPSLITYYLNSGVNISLKTNNIFLVDGANTHKGTFLTIRVKHFPYLPFIIYIEDKTWNLNSISLFFQNPCLLALIFCPSWRVGETNPYVATAPWLIPYGMDNSIPNRKTHPSFKFFCSIRSSILLRHQGLWPNIFCHRWGIKWCKLCFILKYVISVYNEIWWFCKFLLFPNAPPHLLFKNFSSDIFSLYIMMVEVHRSSKATLDLSRAS